MSSTTKEFGSKSLKAEPVRTVAFLGQRLDDLREGHGERLEQAVATLKDFAAANHSITSPTRAEGINLLDRLVSRKFDDAILDVLTDPKYPANREGAREIAVYTIVNGTTSVSNNMIQTVAKAPFETAFFTLHDAIANTSNKDTIGKINAELKRIVGTKEPKSNLMQFPSNLRGKGASDSSPEQRPAA